MSVYFSNKPSGLSVKLPFIPRIEAHPHRGESGRQTVKSDLEGLRTPREDHQVVRKSQQRQGVRQRVAVGRAGQSKLTVAIGPRLVGSAPR